MADRPDPRQDERVRTVRNGLLAHSSAARARVFGNLPMSSPALDALDALAADLERMRKAATARVNYGHNDTCGSVLSDPARPYPCNCGHDDLAAALAGGQEKKAAKRPCSSCGRDDWTWVAGSTVTPYDVCCNYCAEPGGQET